MLARSCHCDAPDCESCAAHRRNSAALEEWKNRDRAKTTKRSPPRKKLRKTNDTRVCKSRGEDPIPAFQAARLSLDVRRQWFPCSHPEQPLGPFVCPCKGCNSSCQGYVTAD